MIRNYQRIAVDVDGVLADLNGVLAAHIGKTPEIFTEPRFEDCPGINPWDMDHILDLMVSPGFVRRLPRYARAAEGFWAIARPSVFVTHQYERSPTWAYDREHWLAATFVPKIPVIFTKYKYMVDADVLIEDSPQNLIEFVEQDPERRRGILIRRPWNRNWRESSAAGASAAHITIVGDMVEAAKALTPK